MEEHELAARTTGLLRRLDEGSSEAASELFELLYAHLRGLAHGMLGAGGPDRTLQPTALVHEAWLRLSVGEAITPESRRHFLRIAARAMRGVVVDHARRKGALKRVEGGERVPLDEALLAWESDQTLDPLVLDELLVELRERDERLADVVDLRFFGGLTEDEVADALELTARQVQHAWKLARAWLARELEQREDGVG